MDPNGLAPAFASASTSSSGTATPSSSRTPAPSMGSQDRLSHHVASITDLSDFDTFDAYQSANLLQHTAQEDDHEDSRQVTTGASVVTTSDSQPALRSQASVASFDALVYDESLGAYTRINPSAAVTISAAAAPATATAPAPTPTAPAITAAPASAPAAPAASDTSSRAHPLHLPAQPQIRSANGSASRPTPAPAPVSVYDSSYGSDATVASPTSYVSRTHRSSPHSPTGSFTRSLSNVFSGRRRNSRLTTNPAYATIMEEALPEDSRESIDMTSLVENAAPMSMSPPTTFSKSYARLAEHDQENAECGTAPPKRSVATETDVSVDVDLTSYVGPSTSQDRAFLEGLQRQEASGKLTLGLGAGFGPGTRLKESDLLANATISPGSPVSRFGLDHGASLRRTLSRRWSSASASTVSSPLASASSPARFTSPDTLVRRGTIKNLAQHEANRRGEIVEVIMEEDEAEGACHNGSDSHTGISDQDGSKVVDLSVMSGSEGPSLMTLEERRKSSIPLRMATVNGTRKTQVFYPQPNWRPFSMRGPYLVALVVISVALGVVQEVIYRISLKRPLVKFTSPSEIPGELYFAMKFAPTLVAVTFGVLWQITDFEVKRLEAFYQMSREKGAVADESINVDYVTYFTFLRPFRALHCKHYAVAVSSVASLLAVSLVPTLGAASIVLQPDREERFANPDIEKRIMISAVWSRTLTAVLLFIAALGCLLFGLLQRRRSGLLSDVKGIAGLASMAVVSHILTDFKGMDLATHKDIHSQLEGHRYILRNSSLAPDDESPVSLADHERYKNFDSRMLSENPHPLMLRARGCIPYICGIVIFAISVPIVLFTNASVLTDKAPWVLTAAAVSIKLGWGGLETSVRMMEPYYILWRRHAPAKTLTLDYTAMPFLWVALQALKNRHLLVFFVAFGTVMTELLTVLVTSLATVEGRAFIDQGSHKSLSYRVDDDGVDRGEETVESFWTTLGLVMFTLAYMSIVATTVYIRRRTPFLPRQPNTISSVLVYIHQSKMLYDFVGTSKMNNDKMLVRLEATGHTYGLGWFEGRDGKTHCGVDQEELLSSYKLNYDYSRSNKPWEEQPEEWLGRMTE